VSSLIIPCGRPQPQAPSGPVPVDYAFIVAAEVYGDVSILDVDAICNVLRDPQPDDIYGAITLVLHDGPDIVLGEREPTYEFAFMVMKMTGGKVLLAPSLDVKVKPVQEPTEERIVATLGTLGANIVAMKAADMVMAALAGQAQMAQNAALAKAAGVG
jgi:hypothetical protein